MIRTPWVCSRVTARLGVVIALVVLAACRQPEPLPALSGAMAVEGSTGQRVRALQLVALHGATHERSRAAFLWGLQACELRASRSALTAFRLAAPEGGMARLAARRLEEALVVGAAPFATWRLAVHAPWLVADDRARLALRGAESLLEGGHAHLARPLLEQVPEAGKQDEARWLRIQALAPGGDGEPALTRLAVEYPHRWNRLAPDLDLGRFTARFSSEQWAAHATAWLEAGVPERALAAAQHAGSRRALLAARALNAMRRPQRALGWARQVNPRDPEGWLEQATALRQLAWGSDRPSRPGRWLETARAAERAHVLAPAASPQQALAALLLAETLVERGRPLDAEPYLLAAQGTDRRRWEWVWRRMVRLQASRGQLSPGSDQFPGLSTRSRRLYAYWTAVAGPTVDSEALHRLASIGFPDLPAQWAAVRLGRRGVPLEPAAAAVPAQPPALLADLLALGRVGDALVAWRADLESGSLPSEGWLGFVSLAGLTPAEAVPLLIRGESRLLSGPWEDLPRSLLEQYLPLPFRRELEAAAEEAGIPPWVLAGLARQESSWNPRVVSPAGAVGLTQLIPRTAQDLVRRHRLPSALGRQLADPAGNLRIGALLLREWQRRLGGSLTVALAAYNGGERRARLFWDLAGHRDGPEFVEGIEVPETWDYVHRVVLLAEGYRALYWPEGKPYPWR